MKHYKFFIIFTIILSFLSIFCEHFPAQIIFLQYANKAINFTLILSLILESVFDFLFAKFKFLHLRENALSFSLIFIFTLIFLYAEFFSDSLSPTGITILSVTIRNIFIIAKLYNREKRLQVFIEKMFTNPAQTILLSFAALIFTGTILLMTDFTTVDQKGLSFFKAIFTATTCVCVNGLSLVDIANNFTLFGQIIILILIQIGGLGIMLLSYFTIYIIRRRVSLEDKIILSYMLSEDDTAGIYDSLKNIVFTSFIIEGIGAVLLFLAFSINSEFSLKMLWFAIFHSISAFCNAGFSLFPDGLEGFRQNPLILSIFALLIILGGIGFSCISNLRAFFDGAVKKQKTKLTTNTKIVLAGSAILLILGTLIFYILEFNNTMKDYTLSEQYFSAFFQSITLRTAGFNTISFAKLKPATYLVCSIFIMIGGASGSTAGGMKINTIAVLLYTLRSYVKGEKHITMGKTEIPMEKVLQANLIFLSNIAIFALSVALMCAVEKFPTEFIIFEISSALGTTGITSGITKELSIFSKILLLFLMFWGRIGALTILSASSSDSEKVKIRWPQADISIG